MKYLPESPPGPDRPDLRALDGSERPLARYFRILETVAAARAGLTLTEIATELGLKAGTVHRLVRGLTDLGLLRNPAGTRRYVSGPRLLNLLYLNLDPTGYAELAQPALDGLVAALGETAHLARLSGDFAEPVLMKQPHGSNRAYVQPGRQFPLHASASGKALLAFQDEAFIADYLARPRTRYTEWTKVDQEEIRRDLERIRDGGIAACDNELDAGVLSYGHPVRAAGGSVLYSVAITGIADRFRATSRELIREKLSEAAAELGKSLGFRG